MVVNTQLYHNPKLIKQLIAKFGSMYCSILHGTDDDGNGAFNLSIEEDTIRSKDVLEWERWNK